MTTHRNRAALALLCCSLAGCSEREAVPAKPLSLAPPETATAQGAAMRGTVTAAGIAATYEADFAGAQLESIRERRTGDQGPEALYEFRGARLVRYAGAPLTSPGEPIELTYDTQGTLLTARQGSGTVAQIEMQEIRTRAQLLRSHALAQHAIHAHQAH